MVPGNNSRDHQLVAPVVPRLWRNKIESKKKRKKERKVRLRQFMSRYNMKIKSKNNGIKKLWYPFI